MGKLVVSLHKGGLDEARLGRVAARPNTRSKNCPRRESGRGCRDDGGGGGGWTEGERRVGKNGREGGEGRRMTAWAGDVARPTDGDGGREVRRGREGERG